MSPSEEPLEIDISRRAERTFVVRLNGDLDLGSASGLALRLEGLPGNGPRQVVVDLSGVAFIDSSGINVLVSLARALAPAGGRLTLAAPSPHVRRVLEIAHVPDIVAVTGS